MHIFNRTTSNNNATFEIAKNANSNNVTDNKYDLTKLEHHFDLTNLTELQGCKVAVN